MSLAESTDSAASPFSTRGLGASTVTHTGTHAGVADAGGYAERVVCTAWTLLMLRVVKRAMMLRVRKHRAGSIRVPQFFRSCLAYLPKG